MSPIYKQAFNGNACEESASGLTLMFMVIITLAAIGMVLIMLRSAMYPYKNMKRNPYLDQDEDLPEYEEYKSYVGYMSEFVNMWKGKGDDESSEPTATWGGSIDSKSEEEKPLSPTTPGISWENDLFRPASLLLSPRSNNGEVGHNTKTPRVRPSSLMFSPYNGASESARNYFNLYSPLSENSSSFVATSQSIPDVHDDEEQPLSPETPSIVWDKNGWESNSNNRIDKSSPLCLGSNASRMFFSPPQDVSKDEVEPLSPATHATDIDNVEGKVNPETPSSTASKDSVPSIGEFDAYSETINSEPNHSASTSKDVAESLLAVGFMGAVLGLPAPNALGKKAENPNLWQENDVDEMPSLSFDDDVDMDLFVRKSASSSVDILGDETENLTLKGNREKELAVLPTDSSRSEHFMHSPSTIKDTAGAKSDAETHPSPVGTLDSISSQDSLFRARFTPQFKLQSIPQVQDQNKQSASPQERDDKEEVSDERSIPKRFNVIRFGTPDFFSPLRRGARDYKKIE